MSTAVVIGLGILVWVLLAILLALFLGRVIWLRDRQGLDPTHPEPPPTLPPGDRAGAASPQTHSEWGPHHET